MPHTFLVARVTKHSLLIEPILMCTLWRGFREADLEFCMHTSPDTYTKQLIYIALPFGAEVASSLLLGR